MTAMNIESVSKQGNVINEDFVCVGSNWLLVLDGSSGLTPRRLTSGPSDAAWFVSRVSAAFSAAIEAGGNEPLDEILRTALRIVAAEFKIQIGDSRPAPLEIPSASCAAARLRGNELDYLIEGDCTIVIRSDASLRLLADERVGAFDRIALEELAVAMATGMTHQQAMNHIKPKLIANRAMKNREDGYWVLEPDPRCVGKAFHGSIVLRPGGGALIAYTDGFGSLVQPFGKAKSEFDLLERIERLGLQNAEKLLLESVESDPDCRFWPRFKRVDDYSCVLARW